MAGPTRLEHALARAAASGNPEAWLVAVVALRSAGAAAPAWDEVCAQVNAWRARHRSVGGRIWVGQLVQELTVDLVAERLEGRTDPADVLELSETLRARTLLDELTLPLRPAPPAAAQRIDALEAELMRLTQEAGDSVVERELHLLSELPLNRQPHAGYARLRVEELERLHDDYDAGLVGVAPVASLASVQDALEPGELLVSHFVPYHRTHPAIAVWALGITSDGAVFAPCPVGDLPDPGVIGRISVDGQAPVDMSPVGSLIAETRSAIQAVDDPRTELGLRALDALLLEPLRAAGAPVADAARVIVAPHRMLHAVPWPALLDPSGRRLAASGPVGLTASASMLTVLRGRRPAPRTTYLGLADPALGARFDPLAEARLEVDAVRRHLAAAGMTCVVHEGAAASEAVLRREATGTAVVHLATHATFPTQEAYDAHLLELAPADGHDGHVRADELRSMDFSETWVVVLSVCDGGLVRFGPAGEPYGLVRALLAAGCGNVVAALWEMDDTACRAVITGFGAALPGLGPVDALDAATAPLREGWPVVDWAGFVTIGSCR